MNVYNCKLLNRKQKNEYVYVNQITDFGAGITDLR